jgi:hypothetical protein
VQILFKLGLADLNKLEQVNRVIGVEKDLSLRAQDQQIVVESWHSVSYVLRETLVNENHDDDVMFERRELD